MLRGRRNYTYVDGGTPPYTPTEINFNFFNISVSGSDLLSGGDLSGQNTVSIDNELFNVTSTGYKRITWDTSGPSALITGNTVYNYPLSYTLSTVFATKMSATLIRVVGIRYYSDIARYRPLVTYINVTTNTMTQHVIAQDLRATSSIYIHSVIDYQTPIEGGSLYPLLLMSVNARSPTNTTIPTVILVDPSNHTIVDSLAYPSGAPTRFRIKAPTEVFALFNGQIGTYTYGLIDGFEFTPIRAAPAGGHSWVVLPNLQHLFQYSIASTDAVSTRVELFDTDASTSLHAVAFQLHPSDPAVYGSARLVTPNNKLVVCSMNKAVLIDLTTGSIESQSTLGSPNNSTWGNTGGIIMPTGEMLLAHPSPLKVTFSQSIGVTTAWRNDLGNHTFWRIQ